MLKDVTLGCFVFRSFREKKTKNMFVLATMEVQIKSTRTSTSAMATIEFARLCGANSGCSPRCQRWSRCQCGGTCMFFQKDVVKTFNSVAPHTSILQVMVPKMPWMYIIS